MIRKEIPGYYNFSYTTHVIPGTTVTVIIFIIINYYKQTN